MRAPRIHHRRNASPVESLERRRCFSYVLPAYASQLGLQGLIDPNTTFEDNFDGSSLDRSKWNVREGPRWRLTKNGSVNSMSWTTEDAVRVGNGNLEMVAHNDPATGRIETGWIQTSKAFLSKRPEGIELPVLKEGYDGSFEQVFGYWEARMKFTSMPGQWSAFWVHSYKMTEVASDGTRANKPHIYGTEYDVVEHASIRNGGTNATNQVSQTANWNGYSEHYRANAVHPSPANGPDDWHVYGLLWTDKSVKFTLDGQVTMVLTDPAAISKVAQTVILSNEAGAPGALEVDKGSNYWGNVPAGGYGSFDSSNARMTVDYVRVWKMAGQATTPIDRNGATIDGFVFQDTDKDGVLDNNEPRVSGRTIYLDLNFDGNLDAGEPTRISDANGEYKFTNLPARIYTARQVMDGNWTQSAPETVADGTISMSGGVTASVDFGLIPGNGTTPPTNPPTNPPAAGTAIVVGTVFNDADGDAIKDANESGRANVAVFIDYNNNGSRDPASEPQATTGADGSYRFEGVKANTSVTVRLALSGTGLTQTLPGSNNGWTVVTASSQSRTVAAFGVRGSTTITPPTIPPTTPGNGSLAIVTGSAFNDANKNGKRDASEAGKSGVSVYLDFNLNQKRDADEPLIASAADGSWTFTNVRLKESIAVRTILAGTGLTQTTPAENRALWIATRAGQTVNAGIFGLNGGTTSTPQPNNPQPTNPQPSNPQPTPGTASATGAVYSDPNKNDRRDGGEAGVANVLVYLDANMNGKRDASETAVRTAADGSYHINGITPAHAAAIRLDLAGTTMQQTHRAGTSNGRWFAPTANQTAAGNDFGVAGATLTGGGITNPPAAVTTADVAGTVFNDANKNGKRDANESFASGTLIYVDENFNGRRDANEQSTTVASNGTWRINGVRRHHSIAIRSTITDATHRFTTAGNNVWQDTSKGGLFNLTIGIAPR